MTATDVPKHWRQPADIVVWHVCEQLDRFAELTTLKMLYAVLTTTDNVFFTKKYTHKHRHTKQCELLCCILYDPITTSNIKLMVTPTGLLASVQDIQGVVVFLTVYERLSVTLHLPITAV